MRRAFTLIELLVAMAVLAVILILMLQIVGGILIFTRTQSRQMDAVAEARTSMDTIAADLRRVVPPDRAPMLVRTSGSGLALLVQKRGPSDAIDHRFLAVRYEEGSNLDLLRSYASVSAAQTDWLEALTGAARETTAARGILAWQLRILSGEGAEPVAASLGTGTDEQWNDLAAPSGWVVLRPRSPATPDGATGIEIWTAATDSQTLELISSIGLENAVRQILSTETDPTRWRNAIDTAANLPAPVKSGIQILSKTLPLP